MTKNQLATELAVSEKLCLSTAVKAVDGIVRILRETLAKGEEITVRGFGSLVPARRSRRCAVDFASRQPIVIPAHISVKFKPAKELINNLNPNSNEN